MRIFQSGMLAAAVLLLLSPVLHAAPDLSFPEGTSFYLYIRDAKNFENNLRKAGLLNLSSEDVDHLIGYAGQKQAVLGFYRELKNLENGNFLKSLTGDVTILQILNEVLIAVSLEKGSSVFSRLMDLFNAKASFNGYYLDFQGDKVLMSRNKATLSFYKTASGRKSPDPVLNNFVSRDMDLLYYKTGNVLIGSWLDPFVSGSVQGQTGAKSMSVVLNLGKKTVSLFTAPRLYRNTAARRARFNGQVVRSSVLTFWDSLQNPYEVLRNLFGAKALSRFENDFRKNFENQVSVALVGVSPEIRPSFMLVTKPTGGNFSDAEKTLAAFLRNVLGEKQFVRESVGTLTADRGETTGIYTCMIAGLFVITDSRDALASSAAVFAGKSPSVWDVKDNARLRDLTDKPAAVFLDFSGLAESVYASMLKSMTLSASQKEHMKNYTRALGSLGSLVGYGEDHRDFNYFHFALKTAQ